MNSVTFFTEKLRSLCKEKLRFSTHKIMIGILSQLNERSLKHINNLLNIFYKL